MRGLRWWLGSSRRRPRRSVLSRDVRNGGEGSGAGLERPVLLEQEASDDEVLGSVPSEVASRSKAGPDAGRVEHLLEPPPLVCCDVLV